MTGQRVLLEDGTVSYGDFEAVRGANLGLEAGVFHVLLGPSGCGKTTLLRAIAGFQRLKAGRLSIGAEVVDGARFVPPERRRVGVVFQDYALFAHLSVGQNVGFGVRGSAAEKTSRALAELEAVGLSGFEMRRPDELSGGQQQRVALARALANDPSVLLMDEPFSNLDPSLRGQLRLQTRELLKQRGQTAVLVTHDADEAMLLADRISVMEGGVICQTGTPQEVYERPVSLLVARSLGPVNGVAVTPEGSGLRTVFGVNDAVEGGAAARLAVVRPEQIVERADGVEARVLSQKFLGAYTQLNLDVGGALVEMHRRGRRVDGPTIRVGLDGPLWCVA